MYIYIYVCVFGHYKKVSLFSSIFHSLTSPWYFLLWSWPQSLPAAVALVVPHGAGWARDPPPRGTGIFYPVGFVRISGLRVMNQFLHVKYYNPNDPKNYSNKKVGLQLKSCWSETNYQPSKKVHPKSKKKSMMESNSTWVNKKKNASAPPPTHHFHPILTILRFSSPPAFWYYVAVAVLDASPTKSPSWEGSVVAS